jgi:hypothetical protein
MLVPWKSFVSVIVPAVLWALPAPPAFRIARRRLVVLFRMIFSLASPDSAGGRGDRLFSPHCLYYTPIGIIVKREKRIFSDLVVSP